MDASKTMPIFLMLPSYLVISTIPKATSIRLKISIKTSTTSTSSIIPNKDSAMDRMTKTVCGRPIISRRFMTPYQSPTAPTASIIDAIVALIPIDWIKESTKKTDLNFPPPCKFLEMEGQTAKE